MTNVGGMYFIRAGVDPRVIMSKAQRDQKFAGKARERQRFYLTRGRRAFLHKLRTRRKQWIDNTRYLTTVEKKLREARKLPTNPPASLEELNAVIIPKYIGYEDRVPGAKKETVDKKEEED